MMHSAEKKEADATLRELYMATSVFLSARDISLLRLLSWTPATTSLLLKACVTFDGEPFQDERRLRERLLTLCRADFLRAWAAAFGRGGLENYYKIAPLGFTRLYGHEAKLPSRAFFSEVSPSLFEHTFRLAETIIATLIGCHGTRVTIERFCRENELALPIGGNYLQPDCFFRLQRSGRYFNLAFEIDQSTESIDSYVGNSMRSKLRLYHAYQEEVLSQWLRNGKQW
jgi:hypothetical protein